MADSKETQIEDQGHKTQVATLAGGCFWCLEAVFDQLKGVVNVQSGYSGGMVANPSYREVCTGNTGHAEAVQITFDPSVISYKDLLQVLFTIHDPTTLNRQGADVGTQYRSAIFYHDPEQKSTAEEVLREVAASNMWNRRIVTKVEPFKAFYRAEDYHKDYYEMHGEEPYCRFVIAPKMAKFHEHFGNRLKNPVTV